MVYLNKYVHCDNIITELNSDSLFSPQILGSPNEFHFLHRALPHARSKRSLPHTRRLKVDPLVSRKIFSFRQLYLYIPNNESDWMDGNDRQ
jgi:hypothetical protein